MSLLLSGVSLIDVYSTFVLAACGLASTEQARAAVTRRPCLCLHLRMCQIICTSCVISSIAQYSFEGGFIDLVRGLLLTLRIRTRTALATSATNISAQRVWGACWRVWCAWVHVCSCVCACGCSCVSARVCVSVRVRACARACVCHLPIREGVAYRPCR